jgi:superkiller protein 3
MPLRPAEDAIHIAMTDHRIARKAAVPPANLVERQDGNVPPYAGPVVPYYPETAISPDIYFEIREAQSGVGQSANALRFYREASKRAPDNWRYLYGLGRALQAAGDPESAISPLQRAVTLAPEENAPLQALGSAYAASRHLPEAIATFRRAIERDPESAAAFHNLGNALALSGDLRGAEAAMREAVRLQPEIAAMRMSLADVLTRNGKLREAAAELREAIRTGPSTESARAAAHTNLGTVYISLGDAVSAIAEYRLAVQADANSVTALMNLGFTLAQDGEAVEARQRLSQALRLDPTVRADLQRAAASADKNVSAIAADVLKTN